MASVTDYAAWPRPARDLAQWVDAAVRAAHAADGDAFAAALVELRRADREQLATLLGAITQDLLERGHPDGLDAEGAEEVLDSCLRAARPWYPALDDDLLLRALTGALGIGDPDDAPAVDPLDVVTHGLLLVADLMTTTRSAAGALIDSALRELMRAQTVELP